jgi:transcriptional regulator with XRE-family HTH domain
MPKGVPYRVQVMGKGTCTYTLTEIAAGTGLSISLISLILRGKRPVTTYVGSRLAAFFGISRDEPFTINVETPRPFGRIVGRIHRHSYY